MSNPLMLVASFGTTHEDTTAKNIAAIEQSVEAVLSGWDVGRVYTSNMVMRILEKRGAHVDNLSAALETARQQGVRRVAVAPTHLLYGEEYEKLPALAEPFSGSFDSLTIGKPLLASTEDLLEVVRVLSEAYPARAGRAVVFMGHGTVHYVNPVYAALQSMFRLAGREDIIMGTVEAYPAIEQVIQQVKQGGFTRALLAPFMLVAGDHAKNDMAGSDEDSWQSLLQAEGVEVEAVLKGLAEYPGILKLYTQHALELAQQSNQDSRHIHSA